MAADASIIDGYAGDLDWFDQATRKGYRSEYQFSGSGATSKSDYYFSLSYLDENGYMKDSGFDRLTGRMAVNIKPVKWLRAGMEHQRLTSEVPEHVKRCRGRLVIIQQSFLFLPLYGSHLPGTLALYGNWNGI